MRSMYIGGEISSLPDISKWNTSNVTDMAEMFKNISSLISLLIFQIGILLMLLLWTTCLKIVHHYHLYQIFPNGILLKLSAWEFSLVI